MPIIKIDHQELAVKANTIVLEAAREAGIEIPHYCYHPALSIVGSCRMCLVQIQGMPKLQVSCNTRVGELPPEKKIDGKYDMVVHTQSEVVKEERKNILEFLLLNHPLDCPVCDQAGECYLQDYSFKYGSAHSRFKENKRVRPNEYLGSKIAINHNRCILCSRCVRFTREVSGTDELYVEARGYVSKIAVMQDKPLDNLLAGNVADICPVGALLSTDYIHKNRIWNLSVQKSVCMDCSVGCNILVHHQNNRIFRVNPRFNPEVNGYFMCDIGRYGFHRYENVQRITSPLLRTDGEFQEIDWEGAMKEIYEHFSRSKNGEKREVAGIASAFHTDETNFIFGKLMNTVFKDRSYIGLLPSIHAEEDITFPSGFRISRDRSPNRQGILSLLSGLVDDIFEVVRKKKIKLMYILDDGVDRKLEDEWIEVFQNLDYLVVQSYCMTPLAAHAHLVLPGSAPLEREGTITNDLGRVQWLRPACKSPENALPDWEIIVKVVSTLGKRELPFTQLSEVTAEMGRECPVYAGITFFKLGDFGMPKNGVRRKTNGLS